MIFLVNFFMTLFISFNKIGAKKLDFERQVRAYVRIWLLRP